MAGILSDMWVYDLNQPRGSGAWKNIFPKKGEGRRTHLGRLNFSSDSKQVWPGSRMQPICWQQKSPTTGEDMFFLFGGYSRNRMSGSDSYVWAMASDLYVFRPSTRSWAYVLGSYSTVDVDPQSQRFPSWGVVKSTSLFWMAGSTTPRLYLHSNPIFDTKETYDLLPMRLERLPQPEWWEFDINNHAFVKLNRADAIENAWQARGTWSDASNVYAILGDRISISSISGSGTRTIPLAGFPFQSFQAQPSPKVLVPVYAYIARMVAQPAIGITAVQTVSCGTRVYLHGSVNRVLVYGYIDYSSQSATFYPLSASSNTAPRAITGAWIWSHPQRGSYMMDGRLPIDYPSYGSELWHQLPLAAPSCTSFRP